MTLRLEIEVISMDVDAENNVPLDIEVIEEKQNSLMAQLTQAAQSCNNNC